MKVIVRRQTMKSSVIVVPNLEMLELLSPQPCPGPQLLCHQHSPTLTILQFASSAYGAIHAVFEDHGFIPAGSYLRSCVA
jgi:hypothetical protein